MLYRPSAEGSEKETEQGIRRFPSEAAIKENTKKRKQNETLTQYE